MDSSEGIGGGTETVSKTDKFKAKDVHQFPLPLEPPEEQKAKVVQSLLWNHGD